MKSLALVKRCSFRVIRVFRHPVERHRGRLRAGWLDLPCALGAAGLVHRKREGDGGTPVARLRAIRGYYRPDRMIRPRTSLPLRPLRPEDGWCDAPSSRLYNRPVRLPQASSHERMWRDDDLYDLVLDLSWNRRPAVPGRGSAIFLHAARPGYRPTEGCIAVHRGVIERLVAHVGPDTVIEIIG